MLLRDLLHAIEIRTKTRSKPKVWFFFMRLLMPLVFISWSYFSFEIFILDFIVGLVIGKPKFIDREIVVGFSRCFL